MTVRPALPGDVPAMAAILSANDEAMDWPDLPELGWPYLDHLVERARAFVAEADGRSRRDWQASVGIGEESVRFLTDLFVYPDRQSRGMGRALLGEVLAGSDERMTFSSGDPTRACPVHPRRDAAVVAAPVHGDGGKPTRRRRRRHRDRASGRGGNRRSVAGVDRRGPLCRFRPLRVAPGSGRVRRPRRQGPLPPSAGHGANVWRRTAGGSITRRLPRMPIRSERRWGSCAPRPRAAD